MKIGPDLQLDVAKPRTPEARSARLPKRVRELALVALLSMFAAEKAGAGEMPNDGSGVTTEQVAEPGSIQEVVDEFNNEHKFEGVTMQLVTKTSTTRVGETAPLDNEPSIYVEFFCEPGYAFSIAKLSPENDEIIFLPKFVELLGEPMGEQDMIVFKTLIEENGEKLSRRVMAEVIERVVGNNNAARYLEDRARLGRAATNQQAFDRMPVLYDRDIDMLTKVEVDSPEYRQLLEILQQDLNELKALAAAAKTEGVFPLNDDAQRELKKYLDFFEPAVKHQASGRKVEPPVLPERIGDGNTEVELTYEQKLAAFQEIIKDGFVNSRNEEVQKLASELQYNDVVKAVGEVFDNAGDFVLGELSLEGLQRLLNIANPDKTADSTILGDKVLMAARLAEEVGRYDRAYKYYVDSPNQIVKAREMRAKVELPDTSDPKAVLKYMKYVGSSDLERYIDDMDDYENIRNYLLENVEFLNQLVQKMQDREVDFTEEDGCCSDAVFLLRLVVKMQEAIDGFLPHDDSRRDVLDLDYKGSAMQLIKYNLLVRNAKYKYIDSNRSDSSAYRYGDMQTSDLYNIALLSENDETISEIARLYMEEEFRYTGDMTARGGNKKGPVVLNRINYHLRQGNEEIVKSSVEDLEKYIEVASHLDKRDIRKLMNQAKRYTEDYFNDDTISKEKIMRILEQIEEAAQ